ncbi:MAG: hypothetical protein AB2733_13090 [Candidatus Thiodiazotropha taylori]
MDNEYLDELIKDQEIFNLLGDKLTDIDQLSNNQVEKLVFYLKSIHGYHPASEYSTGNHIEFESKLDLVRNSDEQEEYAKHISATFRKAMILFILSGSLLVPSVLAYFSDYIWFSILFVAIAVIVIVFADSKFIAKAIRLIIEKECKLFLNSIRIAKSCNELDSCGLFGWVRGARESGPISDG